MSNEFGNDTQTTLDIVPKEVDTTLDDKKPPLLKPEQLVDSFVTTMSAPSENAIAAHNKEIDNKPILGAEYKDQVDSTGEAFDPAIHKVNQKTGKPVISKTGKYFKQNGVSASGVKITPKKSVLGTQVIAAEAEAVKAQEEVKATGKVAAQILFTLGRTVGGDDFVPRPEEDAMISDAFATYFQSKNMRDLPPSAALTVAIMAYILPRLSKPAVASKVDKVKAGLWVWLQGFKRKPIKSDRITEDTSSQQKPQEQQ